MQLTLGMNAFITAQGFARTGMLSVMIGAGLQYCALDPVLDLWIRYGSPRGAATATARSRRRYRPSGSLIPDGKKRSVKIRKKYLRMEGRGTSGAGVGLALLYHAGKPESVITVCFNASLLKYGETWRVGAMTIPIQCDAVSMLPMVDSTGRQPITSHNYGARNAERVKRTFRLR